jgi:hypothetical protein
MAMQEMTMAAQVLQFPDRPDDRVRLIKALLRRFMQATAQGRVLGRRLGRCRGNRTALERADRKVRAEVRALEHMIGVLSHGGGAVAAKNCSSVGGRRSCRPR